MATLIPLIVLVLPLVIRALGRFSPGLAQALLTLLPDVAGALTGRCACEHQHNDPRALYGAFVRTDEPAWDALSDADRERWSAVARAADS